jgi:hypothetical protein
VVVDVRLTSLRIDVVTDVHDYDAAERRLTRVYEKPGGLNNRRTRRY